MGGQRGHRAGFDYSASFIGQGKYTDCVFEINGSPTPTNGWVDDVSTDYAIEFIKRQRDKPFSVILGFKSCHGPFEPPERARRRFSDVRARAVPNLNSRAIYRTTDAPAAGKGAAADDTGRINLDYFRCISAADDNVVRVLNTLDELGLAEDTVVVYASDNGYYLGEHGLGDKRSAYDESLRIPLLIRYPRKVPKGQTRDELVLNIDLAPTIVDLAGAPVAREMQGQSWKPLLTGNSSSWRQSFLFEYFWEARFPVTPSLVGVRTRGAKLITYPGHPEWTELFDLAADPYETKNLAREAAHQDLLARLSAELESQKLATGYRVPDYADKPGITPASADGRRAKKRKQ
jgi:arylsulfatase A-like enzyme